MAGKVVHAAGFGLGYGVRTGTEIVSHHTVRAAMNGMSGMAAAFGTTPAVLGVLGVTTALSAMIEQLEHRHKRNEIRELYEEELAAQLKKSGKHVKTKDVDTLAEGDEAQGIKPNGVVAEALAKTKKQRNLGVALSAVATLGSLALIGVMTGGSHAGLFPALARMPYLHMVAEGAVGLMVYNAIRKPLHWIGSKIFGTEKETAHDRIVTLTKDRHAGRVISPEQVFSVFVASSPELQRFIENEFGQTYREMHTTARQVATETIGSMMQVERLAAEINRGTINVAELAFAVEGDQSGVEHLPNGEMRLGWMARLREHFRPKEKAVEVAAAPEPIVELDTAPRKPFTERLGLTRANTSLGHVERLEQRGMAASQQMPDVG